ncbi:MAG TPA: FeoB-associated Cys-rich membrane protein [Treponemataceae bacterium]|jgi:hypothetical protein|nr:FeoB-associated Cys-rich membrane protein [Treponema sp.]OQB04841.1 MAG: Virus attachment protein p12 family protein [Spirochaetes bacterium ADurb.Bin215]HOF84715.1 FeoB-associated Cys-rich membrane protein [Treponemataceae bacterium]HOS36016.1 FeoB-associated Cys-rich membrane protein [Treponemataceae bacterium]HOU37974.1 FeoB-associated Cys-rich membrane protein [Treponemataceae bacterium]
MATIISGIVLFLLVAGTIVYMIKGGKKDSDGCSGSCRGCSGCH